jgi:U1 small nuclear ribonucleoprotein
MAQFEDPSTVDATQFTYVEKKSESQSRKVAEVAATNAERIKVQAAAWKPSANASATGDAYKTLFVARLSYDTTEATLREVFQDYGTVVNCVLVKNEAGRSRGYAFVEFESEDDLKRAFVEADARKIDGRRVLVDVERGRTVSTWLPRRLGGGAGHKRKGHPHENQNWEGREPPRVMQMPPRGPPMGGGGGPRGPPSNRPPPRIYNGPPPQGAPALRDDGDGGDRRRRRSPEPHVQQQQQQHVSDDHRQKRARM